MKKFISALVSIVGLISVFSFASVHALHDYENVRNKAIAGQTGWKEDQDIVLKYAKLYLELPCLKVDQMIM